MRKVRHLLPHLLLWLVAHFVLRTSLGDGPPASARLHALRAAICAATGSRLWCVRSGVTVLSFMLKMVCLPQVVIVAEGICHLFKTRSATSSTGPAAAATERLRC